jgi:hypothetical protein
MSAEEIIDGLKRGNEVKMTPENPHTSADEHQRRR